MSSSSKRVKGWVAPDYIWHYYEDIKEALALARRSIHFSSSVGRESRFFGMTPDEFNQSLSDMRHELDFEVSLTLLASFEAIFRMDLKERARKKPKDTASRALYKLYRKHKGKVRFDDIISVWKKETSKSEVFFRLNKAMTIRHWLAHGRYWTEKSGMKPDPCTVWNIGKDVFDVLPGFYQLNTVHPSYYP